MMYTLWSCVAFYTAYTCFCYWKCGSFCDMFLLFKLHPVIYCIFLLLKMLRILCCIHFCYCNWVAFYAAYTSAIEIESHSMLHTLLLLKMSRILCCIHFCYWNSVAFYAAYTSAIEIKSHSMLHTLLLLILSRILCCIHFCYWKCWHSVLYAFSFVEYVSFYV
jgi:hypothetical protein